jgi:hypothetical protein
MPWTSLWSSGQLSRVPAMIEDTILAMERDGNGWAMVMRDVSAALHRAFRGQPPPAVRARERADLAWWTARARAALERWSPP